MNGQVANIGSLSPQDGFLVTSADYLSAYSEELLTYLYQPLTGAVGFALYHILQTLVHSTSQPMVLSDRLPHNWLITMLGEDLTTFFVARSRLEALDLVQSYRKTDQIGTYYVYELHAPLPPQEFFHEPLLTEFLREQVGESRFVQIQQHFKKQNFDHTGYTNVSQDFTTVFSAEVETLLARGQTPAARTTQAATSPRPRYSAAQLATFDWDLLIQRLMPAQVNRTQVEANAQLIFTLHDFYKIDEISMANLIDNSKSLFTNQIIPARLRTMARQQYMTQGATIPPVEEPKPAPNQGPSTPPPSSTTPTVAPSQLIPTEAEVLDAAKSLPPAEFLQWQHRRLGTIIGQFEPQTVMSLTRRHALPESVVNVLIHYLVTNYSIVNQNTMDRTANDWLTNHIDTPEKAFAHIRAFMQRNNKNGAPVRSGYRKPRLTPKTKQPAWADPNYKSPAAKPTDQATRAKLAAEMEKLRKNREAHAKGETPS